jgi:hypothetical protein
MIITRENWDQVLNDPPMKFETFVNGAYCPSRKMKSPDSFVMLRYILPEDVIHAVKKRIQGQINAGSVKAKAQRLRWLEMAKSAEKLIEINKEK